MFVYFSLLFLAFFTKIWLNFHIKIRFLLSIKMFDQGKGLTYQIISSFSCIILKCHLMWDNSFHVQICSFFIETILRILHRAYVLWILSISTPFKIAISSLCPKHYFYLYQAKVWNWKIIIKIIIFGSYHVFHLMHSLISSEMKSFKCQTKDKIFNS